MSIAFEPLPFEPGYRRVASAIAARILDRTLKVGDPLPPEHALAAQFQVNRSTIREALRELESGHLVARRRGTKRMVVSRPATGQVAGRVSHALALHGVTVREVWALLEVLEPPAAEAAAQLRSPASVARIAAAARDYADGNADAAVAVEAAAEFLRAVAAATGNRVLPLTHEPLLMLLQSALRIMIDRAPPARGRIAAAQARILAAIASGDAATARAWMGKHIRDFRRGFEVAGIDVDTPLLPVVP